MKNEEWNDPEDINLQSLQRIIVNKNDLMDISVVKDGDVTRPLTDAEKERFEAFLDQSEFEKRLGKTDTKMRRDALFALFMIFVYPLIWISIAHFIFHF